MRTVRFFPLAFIANVHGFILFAIYVILFLSVAMLVQMLRRAW
jgi:hypothetical protein